MALAPGARFGPYEIVGLVGAGGMGEVYRARDPRLGRDVAVKVLPASVVADADMLRRFEQEARAAGGLDHPGILAIHDVGTQDGSPYVVSELLEGETLRARLAEGPLAPRKAVDYGLQIAQGLAAAHDKGIVHRDLKPENLFVTRDDRVKILDFGLAKLAAPAPAADAATGSLQLEAPGTRPGTVLGTVGYMSPEQVRAGSTDHRSDIFALGAVLYEMLAGQRAFRGDSAVEILNAILKGEPPELSQSRPQISPAFDRIVRRCLEKRPEQRFQSAADVAFALEAVSALSTPGAIVAAPFGGGGRVVGIGRALGAAALLVLVAAAGSFLAGRRTGMAPPPTFHRLTFRAGFVSSARFAPDGQTIVFSAGWEGAPFRVFSTRTESPEFRELGLPDADLLSVSSSGEMAVLLVSRRSWNLTGTLARVPLAGGAPRNVLDEAFDADWSPDGRDLGVLRRTAGREVLEYPIGKRLAESPDFRWLRVSPKGDRVAFVESQGLRGAVGVVDTTGRKRVLSGGWLDIVGLAWAASGDEVWFGATEGPTPHAVYAVDLSGKLRLVLRGPAALHVKDVARDGRALLSQGTFRAGITCLPPGETSERDLAWMDWSLADDLSEDGRTILFSEGHDAGQAAGAVYLRKTDGSPAVRLGEGVGLALSPDGKTALAALRTSPPELVLWPTGSGEPVHLRSHGVTYHAARFFPDGKRAVVWGAEPDHGRRLYVLDLATRSLRPLTPEGIQGPGVVSPDGEGVAAPAPDGTVSVYAVKDGRPRPIPGLGGQDRLVRWSADGRSVFAFKRGDRPIRVLKVDVASGRQELWKELTLADPVGVFNVNPVLLSADARSYAYTTHRALNDLFLVEGLK